MKTQKTLLQLGGALSALFFLFHLFLGWRLHHAQFDAGVRSLLEMMNGGGALLILFLAVASLGFTREVLTTALGRTVLVVAAALYLLRAAAEIVVSPHLSPAIFGTCLLTGALYLAALILALRRAPAASVAPAH